jgi:hypothetical protein
MYFMFLGTVGVLLALIRLDCRGRRKVAPPKVGVEVSVYWDDSLNGVRGTQKSRLKQGTPLHSEFTFKL